MEQERVALSELKDYIEQRNQILSRWYDLSWIKEEDMRAIRQQADIVDIMSNYLTLEKKGKNYRANLSVPR